MPEKHEPYTHWTFDGSPDFIIRDHNGERIAAAASERHARLIAAAPDLLRALRRLLEANRRGWGPEFGPQGKDAGVREAAEEIISKVEGR